MERGRNWEQNALKNELIQGMEVAKKLKADLSLASSADNRDLLVQRILSSYDKALLILRWNGSVSKSQTMHQATQTSSPESPISVSRSPPRENIDGARNDQQELRHSSKKRKMMPTWVDQVKVNSESGCFEGPHEDGYSWRKYGQKDILGAKYPRSYYRCTFRNTKGCMATKQVQRSDEDPTIFDITYQRSHTCTEGKNAVLPPKSPDTQEKPHGHNSDIHHAPAQLSQENPTTLINMLAVRADNLGNEEMACPFTSPSTSFACMTQENHSLLLENNSFLSSLSETHLLSPNIPESNYFPSPAFQMNEFDGIYNRPCSEPDITKIISAHTSTTSSPIFDFNFSLDPAEIDPNFPFNTSGFSP